MMKRLQSFVSIIILGVVIKFTDKFFFENFHFHIFLFLIIGAVIYWYFKAQTRKKLEETDFINKKIDKNKFIYAGSYLTGHPKIISPIKTVLLYPKEKELDIYDSAVMYKKKFIASIPFESIINIKIENREFVSKTLSAEHLKKILSSNGWPQKNVESKIAFLTIEWQQDNSQQCTIFSFTFAESFQKNLEMAILAENALRKQLVLNSTDVPKNNFGVEDELTGKSI